MDKNAESVDERELEREFSQFAGDQVYIQKFLRIL